MIVDISDKIYVTYLDILGEEFDKNNIEIDLTNNYFNKPAKAFWGSPEDADWGWKEWCQSNEYGSYDFDHPLRWRLKHNSGKILQIGLDDVVNCNEQLLRYVNIKTNDNILTTYNSKVKYIKDDLTVFSFSDIRIDYTKIVNDNIVAVELLDATIGHTFINNLEMIFNSWDCESICVLWKDAIEFI